MIRSQLTVNTDQIYDMFQKQQTDWQTGSNHPVGQSLTLPPNFLQFVSKCSAYTRAMFLK